MAHPLAVRLHAIAGELGKFVVVGGFCFVLDTVLAYVFYRRVGLGPTTSKTLSTILAWPPSFASGPTVAGSSRAPRTLPRSPPWSDR
jgi:hypothetical protein